MHGYLSHSFADHLEKNARWHGDHPAYVQGHRQLTHRQLLARARQLSSALYDLGVRNQDRVGMLAMNSIEYGEVIAASQWAGFVLATVNFRLAAKEIAWIINDGAPKVLFFEAQYLPMIEALRSELSSVEHYICIDGRADWALGYEAFLAGGDPHGPPCRAREEDVHCLIYTSGTTGRPKGCIWGHREFLQLVRLDAWFSGMQQPDRILIVMPMFHVGGMVLSLSMHVMGGTVYLQREFKPADVIAAIENHGITTLHMAPTMVQMLLEHPGIDIANLTSVRTMLYSAAPMPSPLLLRAMEAFGGCGFVNLYGQTEVSPIAMTPAQHKPHGTETERRRLTSIGQPYPSMEVRIVDESGQDCALGEPGELIVRGTAMFRGYWNNSVATLETLRDGWVHTGDVARVDGDGYVYLVDRKKDVIISGGENIYSREVEEAILQHPAVSECAVIGLPDPMWGEQVCAIVTLRAGTQVTEQELIDHCRLEIAGYKKPGRVVFTDELPKLVTGKINKQVLRSIYARACN